jgi:hypothetical protein
MHLLAHHNPVTLDGIGIMLKTVLLELLDVSHQLRTGDLVAIQEKT